MIRPPLWLRATIDSCRSAAASRLALAGVAFLCSTGIAHAGGPPGVVNIDGDLQDMIEYANSISVPSQGCAFAVADPAQDVRIFDPKIIPCTPVVDNYYVNGFDQVLDVLAYDRTAQTLFLGLRVAGAIGDPDGNGNPDTRCPEATFDDETGIGFDDSYKWELNLDCAGAPEITIEVRNNQLTVTGATPSNQDYAFNGSDLEVAIAGLVLPPAYNVRVFAGNIADGLGEDLHELSCQPPGPQITVDKSANPERICPGANTTFTVVVTNPGVVELQQVSLVDDLPAGLSYVAGSASNNCGVGAPNVVGQQITWPNFSLAPGASCTFTFQAQAGAQCLGPQLNNATATGSFATPCFQGGEPQTVQDSDDATVTCAPLPCVDITEISGPPSACVNANVQITGSVQNCSPEAETIVVSLVGGGSVNLGSVGAGQTVPFSLTGNMGNCTAGQNVTFAVDAVATNECGTDDDKASVGVLCQAPPCVEITVLNAPADACQNTNVTISGTVQNCGGDPATIVVVLNGGAPQNLGVVAPGATANFEFTANMGACTAGQNVPFTVVATATNDCGEDTDTDTRNVLCKVGPCVNITALDGPGNVCPNTAIQITGTVENCSPAAETIVVTINGGDPQNLGSVAAGGSANFTFNTNSGECTAGQNLVYTVVATATNDCGETSDTEIESVRCNALPCVEITAVKAPLEACQNAPVTIEVSIRNCSIDPEEITVSLNGGAPVNLGTVAAGASVTHTFNANMGECAAGQNVPFSVTAVATNSCGTDDDTEARNVLCKVGPCVELTLDCSPERACAGSPVTLSGTATNCSADPEDIVVEVGGSTFTFSQVQPNGTVSFTTSQVSMPACTDGQLVEFSASARATNDCGEATDQASCSIECQEPEIDVEKSAEAEVQSGGTIHYVITLTNPSKTVTLENIEVCDDLCSAATYAGNANPAPASEPAVGSAGGTICWNVQSLAPGASLTFTFEAIAVGGGAQCTEDVTCTNTVRASGECGADEATDTDSFDTVIPCEQGLCRFTGGGTLNEDGDHHGRKQHSFGGNVSPCPTGDGTTGDSWQHIKRDGNQIQFNFHTWEPCITACSVVPPGPCSPNHGETTRADWSGPGRYSLGSGSRERDAYFEAVIIDHNEGSCNQGQRDEYGITVWDSETNQVVFTIPLQETDTGNLQIHHTPRRIFGAPTGPAPAVGEVTEVALLGRPYPNPFAASMSFGYEVPTGEGQAVEIGVYNVAGRLITRLASEVQGPGRYTVRWDGRDAAGVQMAPGVYFLKSRVGQTQTVSRLLKIAE